MRDLNLVTILGNLGADPELKHTQNGTAVVNLRIATNERWKDKEENLQERVEWHTVVAFGPSAEFADKYLRKGSRVSVQGKLQTRKWTDKESVERYSTEIIASDLGSQDRKGDSEGSDAPAKTAARPAAKPAARPAVKQTARPAVKSRPPAQEQFEDELSWG